MLEDVAPATVAAAEIDRQHDRNRQRAAMPARADMMMPRPPSGLSLNPIARRKEVTE